MDLYGIYKQISMTALPSFYVFIIALQFPVLNRWVDFDNGFCGIGVHLMVSPNKPPISWLVLHNVMQTDNK